MDNRSNCRVAHFVSLPLVTCLFIVYRSVFDLSPVPTITHCRDCRYSPLQRLHDITYTHAYVHVFLCGRKTNYLGDPRRPHCGAIPARQQYYPTRPSTATRIYTGVQERRTPSTSRSHRSQDVRSMVFVCDSTNTYVFEHAYPKTRCFLPTTVNAVTDRCTAACDIRPGDISTRNPV